MTGPGVPDEYWRRPEPGSADGDGTGDPHGYPGPPAAVPPSPQWRPPVIEQPSQPRRLPELDDAAIDHAEERAARVTYAVGAAACLVLMIMACSRLFG